MLASVIRSRHSWWLGIPTGLLGFALLLAPGNGAHAAPNPLDSQQRIRELEERVKIFELEHEALDRRMKLQTERTGRTFEELDIRIRALEAARLAAEASPPPEKSAAVDEFCKDPYIHFPNGIRRVKSGCEDAAKPCDVPQVIDARGMWTVRPECVPATATKQSDCDVPYFIDGKGIKQFKPACM